MSKRKVGRGDGNSAAMFREKLRMIGRAVKTGDRRLAALALDHAEVYAEREPDAERRAKMTEQVRRAAAACAARGWRSNVEVFGRRDRDAEILASSLDEAARRS